MTSTRRTISRSHSSFSAPRGAFTLIELLIVLAIIGLLAAILFPAFKNAQESAVQASCATNLKNIYAAVELYRQDEKVYPASLAVLLPNDFNLPVAPSPTAPATITNTNGTGFFKGGKDAMICGDDDSDITYLRSSYGNISTDINALAVTGGNKSDMGRYVWNYWGYRPIDNTATCKTGTTDVSECAGTAYQTASAVKAAETAGAGAGWDANLLVEPGQTFNHPTATGYDNTRPVNVLKYSLANRFAPTSTIITHCVYHRLPTASGKIFAAYEITTNPTAGSLAKDIVLRRDGTAKLIDISQFNTNNNWAKQNF